MRRGVIGRRTTLKPNTRCDIIEVSFGHTNKRALEPLTDRVEFF